MKLPWSITNVCHSFAFAHHLTIRGLACRLNSGQPPPSQTKAGVQ
ncbi:MAG: hypothetical protein U0X75_08550 [Acidobacteriota bacterium]